jgi:hypothetical protein
MKKPISNEGYAKVLQSIESCDNHVSKVIKKYRRIIKESQKKNDIESAYLAYEIISMIIAGSSLKEFKSVNNHLTKSLQRCALQGAYTLEEFDGVKFSLRKEGDSEWILTNKKTGISYYSKFYNQGY